MSVEFISNLLITITVLSLFLKLFLHVYLEYRATGEISGGSANFLSPKYLLPFQMNVEGANALLKRLCNGLLGTSVSSLAAYLLVTVFMLIKG
jgi:hypothetical protein